MEKNKSTLQRCMVGLVQKIAVYETKSRFYLVGSNSNESKFKVIKIDRLEPKDLNIHDDHLEYTAQEVKDLLQMIDQGNRFTKVPQKGSNSVGLKKTHSAFGIVGFVRFLEGYYMILITKRRKVSEIGPHTIYKIEDTTMVYIPNVNYNSNNNNNYGYNKMTNPDENRYVKMFQNVDLSSNFYYSHSYDLSNTLQHNMTPNNNNSVSEEKTNDIPESSWFYDSSCVGVRWSPCWRFVWNEYLLKDAKNILHFDWLLYITHGFIGQSNINVYNKNIFLTLIARRSNKFAGTRYLKRGANMGGSVANEVETEQIIIDASYTNLDMIRFTSFVQTRGSIPLYWSQDNNKMVPKPPIILDQSDPFGSAAGQHFNQLLGRFGSPVIVLDLVKKKEKKKHESLLSDEFVVCIKYLNQFLPVEHRIKYIGYDMARVSKNCPLDVLASHEEAGRRQNGVVRTNCIDCLDRTNTAQYAIAKCALIKQLYSLGVIDNFSLDYDSDCMRMMEDLFEDQGDTLALQYGGSQLVHRIRGYRKLTAWTSSSRDIMQTLSRYYSNTFSDSEKQNAMNIFLGVFIPSSRSSPSQASGSKQIWELSSDYYIHNEAALDLGKLNRRSYCQWWDQRILDCLPYSYEDESKGILDEHLAVEYHERSSEQVNLLDDLYKPHEMTSFDDLFAMNMSHSLKDFMPKSSSDISPFCTRMYTSSGKKATGYVCCVMLYFSLLPTNHSTNQSTN
ncbi:hypothetical protein HELRODRAFT_72070 [Helobdella robusta]|uniref:SAC domain-containing protein n=1 Tax=Helobdella robusta TaxID=6412 RepID=T1G0U9_HELRO|nr:hypothetical protein HELRODRAFT_72070 [Helobdella robusta]ESO10569.1 hypothetical protein HELRODRAFT_72070 [Helobdella robusta]